MWLNLSVPLQALIVAYELLDVVQTEWEAFYLLETASLNKTTTVDRLSYEVMLRDVFVHGHCMYTVPSH